MDNFYTMTPLAPTWFIMIMMAAALGVAYWVGYRDGRNTWKDREQWLLAQRTVEQQMKREGWKL